MIIRIASTRVPKINGVRNAVRRVSGHFHFDESTISFETQKVDSGVSHTPTSVKELMDGAHQRAEAVYSTDQRDSLLALGVEGGLFSEHSKVFLQSWTCVYDGSQFYYGCSGAIQIPDALATSVLEHGNELGHIIDVFAGEVDVRSNQGTFGVLSRDLVTREHSFETATTFALIPYFNKTLYGRQLSRKT